MTIELTEGARSFLEEQLYVDIEDDYEYIMAKYQTANDIPAVMSFMDALVPVLIQINPGRGQECADMLTECFEILGVKDIDEVYEVYGEE